MAMSTNKRTKTNKQENKNSSASNNKKKRKLSSSTLILEATNTNFDLTLTPKRRALALTSRRSRRRPSSMKLTSLLEAAKVASEEDEVTTPEYGRSSILTSERFFGDNSAKSSSSRSIRSTITSRDVCGRRPPQPAPQLQRQSQPQTQPEELRPQQPRPRPHSNPRPQQESSRSMNRMSVFRQSSGQQSARNQNQQARSTWTRRGSSAAKSQLQSQVTDDRKKAALGGQTEAGNVKRVRFAPSVSVAGHGRMCGLWMLRVCSEVDAIRMGRKRARPQHLRSSISEKCRSRYEHLRRQRQRQRLEAKYNQKSRHKKQKKVMRLILSAAPTESICLGASSLFCK
mmetsp:Transcript_5463/g.10054  ORF Transcript_5463/g.10054 Transcript_5463/m.10054 type:complete len:342 (-) Transcript_5463:76-1101(-)